MKGHIGIVLLIVAPAPRAFGSCRPVTSRGSQAGSPNCKKTISFSGGPSGSFRSSPGFRPDAPRRETPLGILPEAQRKPSNLSTCSRRIHSSRRSSGNPPGRSRSFPEAQRCATFKKTPSTKSNVPHTRYIHTHVHTYIHT